MTTEVYVDNASTTFPKPECVYRAIDRYLRHCGGSPGRAAHRKAREAEVTNLRADSLCVCPINLKEQ